ncbi:FkbM family methyltransferase [Stanieria sp. NIES-3757]|nr:FkbM family methyltransferase [Stanieria sp. NIES-3757]
MKAFLKKIAQLINISNDTNHDHEPQINSVPTEHQINPIPAIYLGHNLALTRTIYGHKLFVDTRDISLTPHLLLDGYWESWISKFFLNLVKPGMRVVEVGSNIGYYSLLAASQVGTSGFIYSFEANPQIYNLLKKNLEINGFLPISNCINKAVTDRAGTVKFKILKEYLGGSSVCRSEQQELVGQEAEIIEIESISLDLELGNNAQVDILKIDAEGAEPLIIKGAINLLKNNQNIKVMLEFHIDHFENKERAYEYLELMRHLGFKINLITEDSLINPVNDQELINYPKNHELFLFR